MPSLRPLFLPTPTLRSAAPALVSSLLLLLLTVRPLGAQGQKKQSPPPSPVASAPKPAAAAAAVAPAAAAPPAASASPAAAAATTAAPLSPAQMSGAAAFDEMTVPTPGELFTALGKQVKANWSGEFRPPIPTAYGDRAQIALNLGGLIADGYLAVEAQDAQQVKNLGKDILKLASSLGVAREILDRGKTITQFADDNDWNQLKEELEATQNEVRQAMDAKRDEELTTLVTLGGWVRGTQAVSDVVVKNFNENAASILRQPALVAYLRGKLAQLPAKEQEKPLIRSLGTQLEAIEKLVSFPAGTAASKEDVQKLYDQAAAMVKEITTKS